MFFRTKNNADDDDNKAEDAGNFLAGKVLLATPNLGDSRFQNAVIYLCAHSNDGAMGLVVNQKMPGVESGDLLKQLNLLHDDSKIIDFPVYNGGPVDNARGFLLHDNTFSQNDTIKVDDGFSVTGTVDALRSVVEGSGPKDLLFALGYAGWSAGQLEQEIQQNAWLVCDPDNDLIFSLPSESKWEAGLNKIGVDPALLMGVSGNA